MPNPWAQIDQMRRDHQQLKTTLDTMGWRLVDSDDGFYVASRKSAKGWPPEEDRRVRAVNPALLLERIDEREKKFAPKTPAMAPTPTPSA